jgi:hypothetical protein
MTKLICAAIIACIGAGFYRAACDFGVGGAAGLSLPLVLPLVVAVRLICRRPSASKREIAYLGTAFGIACAVSIYAASRWDAVGIDDRHSEEVQWSQFESEFRRDPAFQHLTVEWNKKSRHYLVGDVASKADLDRLQKLAEQHGVRWPLDGPWAYSKSLRVRP